MTLHEDPHPDLAAASVSLAAEAALLEGRLTMLHETLASVDARINALTDTLRQIRASSPQNPNPTARDSPTADHTLTAGIFRPWSDHPMPC
ncbi:hypothetical protein [Streptomyces sp. ADI93-02]|uniref:hypothetical protein n=1 Tax=Streptomyces sp. ADI93-02 TaxID=1522757 RepID=UPI000F558F4B|nr:hypothetical protein [Streptomyces sp. ADI93-02]RPK32205.1 hypothetical protein EES40_36575 [Streptomyces sp. ADI93-02]